MERITDIQELRGIQMGILDEIHRFCTSRDIRYFLSSGSLLGAVRHGGYIPWDDDLDIYMPRTDYERFLDEWDCGVRNGDDNEAYEVINPATADAVFERAWKSGESRVISGCHWQSDVDASRPVASLGYARLQVSQEFQQAMARAQEELRRLTASSCSHSGCGD